MSWKNITHRIAIARQGFARTLCTESTLVPEAPNDDKDRSQPVSVDTSIKYIESKAYRETYGDDVVWKNYRRNKVGHFLKETRQSCIKKFEIATASPCPICRDKYLVLHHLNVKLLKQFISPHNGGILPSM